MRFVPSEKICPFFLLFPAVKEKNSLLNKYRPAYLYACGRVGDDGCTQNREQGGMAASSCHNPPKP